MAEHPCKQETRLTRLDGPIGHVERLYGLVGKKVGWSVFRWIIGAMASASIGVGSYLLLGLFERARVGDVKELQSDVNVMKIEMSRRAPILDDLAAGRKANAETLSQLAKSLQAIELDIASIKTALKMRVLDGKAGTLTATRVPHQPQ
jgi:hypothetical protein